LLEGCIGLDWSKTDWCVNPALIPGRPDCADAGKAQFPNYGVGSSQRLLKRQGVISEIPADRCNPTSGNPKKNVILVVGDGMGWEMIRAGAIARQVLTVNELEAAGCDTVNGCPDLAAVQGLFTNRTLDDYYTEGKF